MLDSRKQWYYCYFLHLKRHTFDLFGLFLIGNYQTNAYSSTINFSNEINELVSQGLETFKLGAFLYFTYTIPYQIKTKISQCPFKESQLPRILFVDLRVL